MGTLVACVDAVLAAGFALAACLALWPVVDAELGAMTAAGAAALAAILFLLPMAVERRSLRRLLGVAAVAAGLACALALSAPAPAVSPADAAGLGLAAALLTGVAGALAVLVRPLAGTARAAIAWPSAALIVTAAAPVWLGPLIYRADPAQPVTDAVVALSPLTHFAVPAGVDYLRSDWFYRNAPFGGIRYEYPGLAVVVAGYGIAAALAWAASGIRSPHRAASNRTDETSTDPRRTTPCDSGNAC